MTGPSRPSGRSPDSLIRKLEFVVLGCCVAAAWFATGCLGDCAYPPGAQITAWPNLPANWTLVLRDCVEGFKYAVVEGVETAFIGLLESADLQFQLMLWSNTPDFAFTFLSVVFSQHMPVWTANIQSPVNSDASLSIDSAGTLSLIDGNGTIVWRVEERASGMELLNLGNLRLYNSSNHTVWESFLHPTDTLVPDQPLLPGMQLTSNSSVYSASMYKGGIVFSFAELGPRPVPYRVITFNSLFSRHFLEAVPPCPLDVGGSKAILSSQDKELRMVAPCVKLGVPTASTPYYVRLNNDGSFRAYTRYDSLEGIEHDAELELDHASEEPWMHCVDPEACGRYSICSPSATNSHENGSPSTCSCPKHSMFQSEVPAKGCKLAIPLSPQCDNYTFQNQQLIELRSITFVPMLISGWNTNTRTLEDCKQLCRFNCTCAATFYDHDASLCFPVNTVMTLMNVNDSRYSAFVKVVGGSTTAIIPAPPGHELISGDTVNLEHLIPSIVLPIIIALACLSTWYILLKLRSSSGDEASDPEDEEILTIATKLPHRFSFRELDLATKGFCQKLGAGGFGSVFEGVLSDGRKVAVKKLDQSLSHGSKQFLAEVIAMGRIDHLNIVRLVGFCSERSRRLLVYEFMTNGSVDKWLFDEHPGSTVLGWDQRFNVAVGTARGLAYLHNECTDPILHLDIKPQNILLDAEFVPKVADFGLSRQTERAVSVVVTGVRGTPGYIAPEWLLHSKVTRKCDVYSFGMLLLEIVGGRKNIRLSWVKIDEEDDWYFPSYVFQKWGQGKILDVVDIRLQNTSFAKEQARRMIMVALWCIQEDPDVRPGMAQVLKMLEGSVDVLDPPLAQLVK